MPRANRHHLPHYVWHITHRCHRGQFLLRFVRDRQAWLHWLYAARKRYGLCVLDYAVTSNHIHLLVRDHGRGEIARSLQLVAGQTAQAYNARKRPRLCRTRGRRVFFWSVPEGCQRGAIRPPYPRWWPPDTDEYQWLEQFGQRFNILVHPDRSSPGPARLVFTLETIAGPVDTHGSVALRKGGRVFRFGLEYEASDPDGPTYDQVFSGIIDSLVLGALPAIAPAVPTAGPTAVSTP